MARLLIDGWETGSTGDVSRWTSSVGTSIPSANSSIVNNYVSGHAGAWSGSFQYNGATARNVTKGSLNNSTLYVRVYFYLSIGTNPTSDHTQAFLRFTTSGGTNIATIHLKTGTTGACNLLATNDVGGTDTGFKSITSGAWHMLEVKLVVHASTGILEIKLDGTTYTLSSQNTGSTNIANVILGVISPTNDGGTVNFYTDDIAIDDAAYPGLGVVIARQPTTGGTPTYDGFTKSSGTDAGALWDNTPFDTTDTCVSPGTGDPLTQSAVIATFASTQTGHGTGVIGSSDTINGAQAVINATRSGGGGRTFELLRRDNTTDTLLSAALTTGNVHYASALFSPSSYANLNANMQVGGKKSGGAGGQSMTINDVWLMVDYTPASNTTTTQTITGKSRIQKVVSQTITGKAAIRKTTTQTITGKSRIKKVVQATITGLSRIQKIVQATLTGKANIRNTTQQTLTGKSRIQKAATQTITGKARLNLLGTQTIAGKARVQATSTFTITGKARVQKSVSQTITGKSLITTLGVKTIQGVARITATTLRTLTGRARIQATTTKTIQGKGRIQKSVLQTIPGVSRILRSMQATISGKSRITATSTKTLSGRSRITATTAQTITGLSRMTATTLQTITGIAKIGGATVQTIQGKARLQKTAIQTIPGQSRIQRLVTQTIGGRSRIAKVILATINGTARIRKTVSQTITGVARIRVTVTRTITGKARIAVTTTQVITGIARLLKQQQQTIQGRSRLQKTVNQLITGKAAIRVTTSRTISGRTRIQLSYTQNIQGRAKISNIRDQTIPGRARITVVTQQQIFGRARIFQPALPGKVGTIVNLVGSHNALELGAKHERFELIGKNEVIE